MDGEEEGRERKWMSVGNKRRRMMGRMERDKEEEERGRE